MNTHRTVTSGGLRTASMALFCVLLSIFSSCTKEKETERSYPRVSTGVVTNINAGGATFNGSFLQAGNSEVIDHGFVFGTGTNPIIQSDERISLGTSTGSGSFTATAYFGLENGKTYYVSAYAQNKEKIFYAEHISFVSMGSASPEILSIVPSEGSKGDTVVIKGKYFSQLSYRNTVQFGDSEASIIEGSDTTITVRVPSTKGIEHVDVFVTTVGQTAQKISGFRYLKPVITGLSPKQGVIGDTITVTGKYLRPDVEIKFNQVKSKVYKSDNVSARVIVPACQSTSANISATIDGLTSVSEQTFTYAKAEITGLLADKGVVGDTMIILGKNFGYSKDAVSVFVGEQPAVVAFINNSSIKAVIPISGGKTTYPITVKVDGQAATGYRIFTYHTPEVISLSVSNGVVGDTIMILGKNFGYVRPHIQVHFEALLPEIIETSNTSVKIVIPSSKGITSSPVSVNVGGQLASGQPIFTYLLPEILSLSSAGGVAGDTVMIYGKNFGYKKEAINVRFGEQTGVVTHLSKSYVKAVVPLSNGGYALPVRVTFDQKTAMNAPYFNYLPPEIESFTPNSGKMETQMVIKGKNFSITKSYNKVTIDKMALDVISASPTELVAKIPLSAYSSNSQVVVEIDSRKGQSAGLFEVISPWVRKNDFNTYWGYGPYRYATMGFTIGETGYIISTYKNEGSGEMYDIWQYDHVNDLWKRKSASPYIKFYQIRFVANNKFYANSSNKMYEYNPETNLWTEKNSMHFFKDLYRWNYPFSINNKGYAIYMSDANLEALWEYDVEADKWTQKNNSPIAPTDGVSCSFTVENKGYICGGGGIWEYLPSSDSWTQKAKFSSNDLPNTTFVINKCAYFVYCNGYTEGSLWEYNSTTNIVRKVCGLPKKWKWRPFSFTVNQKAYIGSDDPGGSDLLETASNVWEFDPSKL